MELPKRNVDGHVAVYWDFENIHASLYDMKYGQNAYRNTYTAVQERLVDIASIMDYISGLGIVNINKAYANWGMFRNYQYDLQEYSIDLIQLFPRGSHGKNGADIRLAIDVVEDITTSPHISRVVVIGCDSDYIAVAQKVRQRAKQIVGIGVKEFTNTYWMKSCNEFKFYTSLLVKSAAIQNLADEGYETSKLSEAKELLVKAIRRLTEVSGEPFARKAALKPMMLKLDPSFDEGNYGYRTFSDLLVNCKDTVTSEQGTHDHHIRLVADSAAAQLSKTGEPARHLYEMILRKQKIFPLPRERFRNMVKLVFNAFQEFGGFSSIQECGKHVMQRAEEDGFVLEDGEFERAKDILYKAFSFRFDHSIPETRLNEDIQTADALYVRAMRTMTKRLLDNLGPDEVDAERLAKALWGDSEDLVFAKELIDGYRASVSRQHGA